MSDAPRITLVTSNGWGLGHLSRELAVALAIGDRAEVTFFSFSPGLPLLSRFGIRGEYCPGHSSPWIPRNRWDSYVQSRFEVFVSEVSPEVVLFDGVAPYNGVINALRKHPDISLGWMRRGMWLHGPTTSQLTKSGKFDFIIEPGDLAAEADRGPTAGLDATRVPPVSLFEVVPALSREEAAADLGLDPARPALLFGLGPDARVREVVLQTALRHPAWQVAVITSPIADDDQDVDGGGVPVRGLYPLVGHLAAFDAGVSAAGYNSVHELVPARIPTLFVPKSTSTTDDQVARASHLADLGLALVATDDDPTGAESELERLLGDSRTELSERLGETPTNTMMGGAGEVADILTSGPPRGVRETGPGNWRQPGIRGVAKRALGRIPLRPRRVTVSLDPEEGTPHLLFGEDPGSAERSMRQPVEHLLPGSTSSYRTTRRNLIDDFYDLIR